MPTDEPKIVVHHLLKNMASARWTHKNVFHYNTDKAHSAVASIAGPLYRHQSGKKKQAVIFIQVLKDNSYCYSNNTIHSCNLTNLSSEHNH